MSVTTPKKATSVSFCTALKRDQFVNDLTPQSRPTTTACSPKLPEHFEKIDVAKTAEIQLNPQRARNTYDDNEIISQPDSSASPESYVDHILSAASSVSMRSSSLSSNTEVGHLQDQKGVRDILGGGRSLHGPIKTVEVTVEPDVVAGSRRMQICLEDKSVLKLRERIPSTRLRVADAREGNSLEHQSMFLMKTNELQADASDKIEVIADMSRLSHPPKKPASDTPFSQSYPEDLKCKICNEVYQDPRILNCLHSFCLKCLIDEKFKQGSNSAGFWSQSEADNDMDSKEEFLSASTASHSLKSSGESSSEMRLNKMKDEKTTSLQRSSFGFRRKKSVEKPHMKSKSVGRTSSTSSSTDLQIKKSHEYSESPSLICRTCSFATPLPCGGLSQLTQNQFVLRKIDKFHLKITDDVITRIWCSLCFKETNAAFHCVTCMLNLCTLCKDAHQRQRNTTDHRIQNILELRRAKNKKQTESNDKPKPNKLKCTTHPSFEMKYFCTICLQLACADCLMMLHKGHKRESVSKAFIKYTKALNESLEQTRPLYLYAQNSIDRLNRMTKTINAKCDAIRTEVEDFMKQYTDAVEVHRQTLLKQVQRARETKVETILEQQMNLEKCSSQVMDTLRFSQDLKDTGSDVEFLSLISILLKRFEFCVQFKSLRDQKVSASIHFLPNIRAPSTQNNIPLFGMITTQTVEPGLCTLDTESLTHLRLHKKIELKIHSRDADGSPLCHGGLQPKAQLKYKEYISKSLAVEISDNRDGTYGIAFTPDMQGTILLGITIDNKPIKGSPFVFLARALRPHNGIYHCCTFCSSKGDKLATCACQGRMPGHNGCGHGHAGHPGRRHWSCCGNILENSECPTTNKLLKAE